MYRFSYTNPRAISGWLSFIHAVNERDAAEGRERTFGQPTLHETWNGEARLCEEYAEARVILPLHALCERGDGDDEGVRIVPTSARTTALFAGVARDLGISGQ